VHGNWATVDGWGLVLGGAAAGRDAGCCYHSSGVHGCGRVPGGVHLHSERCDDARGGHDCVDHIDISECIRDSHEHRHLHQWQYGLISGELPVVDDCLYLPRFGRFGNEPVAVPFYLLYIRGPAGDRGSIRYGMSNRYHIDCTGRSRH
jgi:hypothetical protein